MRYADAIVHGTTLRPDIASRWSIAGMTYRAS